MVWFYFRIHYKITWEHSQEKGAGKDKRTNPVNIKMNKVWFSKDLESRVELLYDYPDDEDQESPCCSFSANEASCSYLAASFQGICKIWVCVRLSLL